MSLNWFTGTRFFATLTTAAKAGEQGDSEFSKSLTELIKLGLFKDPPGIYSPSFALAIRIQQIVFRVV